MPTKAARNKTKILSNERPKVLHKGLPRKMSTPSLDQQDTESVSSVDSFDPAPTLVLKKITREEALEQTSEHIGKMGKSKFLDKLLKPAVSKWLTEPILRVLPPKMKHNIHAWCLSHDPMWFNKLSEFIDEDISEWEYTVEVPNRRKDMAWCGNRGIIVIGTLVVFLAFSYNKGGYRITTSSFQL